MTENTTLINLLIDEDRKEKWEEYVEQSDDEYASLSQLIRRSVEREMNQQDTEDDDDSGVLAEHVSEIIAGLNRLERRIDEVDNRVAGIERDVRDDPDIRELANEVFGVLPTKQDIIEYEKTASQAGAQPDAPITHSGLVDDLAKSLDEKDHRVSRALRKLRRDTHQVQTMTLSDEVEGWNEMYGPDEETRYFKEG